MLDWSDYATIGVVSDTHLPDEGPLPSSLMDALCSVDAVIHLGDFNDFASYQSFQSVAAFAGVYGNLDDDQVRQALPEKVTLTARNHSIGLVHGWGPPVRLEKRVRTVFPAIDMILFGHSHVPGVYTIGETVLLNPGSATCNRDGSKTFARLQIGDTIQHEIITLSD